MVPEGVLVGDEEKYRRWFVEKMIVQIEADGDCTHLLRPEGSILTLLEAVNSWRHGRVAFDFFWAQLPDGVPPLIAGHDAHLLALLRSMGLPSA